MDRCRVVGPPLENVQVVLDGYSSRIDLELGEQALNSQRARYLEWVSVEADLQGPERTSGAPVPASVRFSETESDPFVRETEALETGGDVFASVGKQMGREIGTAYRL